MIDAVVVQSLSAEGDALAVQVSGDGGAVEAEAVGQFVDGLSGAVSLDEVSDLPCRKPDRGRATDTDSVTRRFICNIR